MPVQPEASPSPERYERSPTPEPVGNGEGPSKRPRLKVEDIQRYKVEKLMSNPERDVRLPMPQGPFASELLARMPKDIIKSVSGSAAAAGSGEFHVYKNSRRREFERVKLMEEQQRALAEQKEFLERQAARDAAAEAKTAKNRAKRQKRKAARRGSAAAEDNKKTKTLSEAPATGKLSAAPSRNELVGTESSSADSKRDEGQAEAPPPIAEGVEIKVLDED